MGGVPQAQAAPVIPPQPQEYLSTNGDAVTIKASESDLKAAASLTREMRLAAKPLPLINVKSSDLQSMQSENYAGGSGSKPGGMPDPAALARAQAENPEAWQGMNAQQSMGLPVSQSFSASNAYGKKNIYTGYLGNYWSSFWTNYPYSTVGKLYFYDAYGYLNYCTASLIDHDNIVTAAHCVYDTDYNYWYHGFVFVPAEAGGNAPYGTYNWYSATVLGNWIKAKKATSGTRYDVAVLTMYGDPGYSTGWLGYSWGWNAVQLHHAVGYPYDITSGNYSYICAAESFQKSADVLGMGCDMTYGSSGGPWINLFIPYQDQYPYSISGNYVNAVVSSGKPGTPTFYGPKFTTKSILVLCYYEYC
jgi:V8-like Glu-specific endopeptidase